MVTLPAFQLVGLSIRTTNQNGQAAEDIGALWGKIMSSNVLARIPHQSKQETISLYYDYEGDWTQPYSCLIGVPVERVDDPLPEGLVAVSIPEQAYTLFEAKGPMPDAVAQTWKNIWQHPPKRNYQFDFEVYDANSFSEPPVVKIWVGCI